MRSLVGASVPLWVTQMFHNMGFQYAGLLLALISCCILVRYDLLLFSTACNLANLLIVPFSQFPSCSSNSVDRFVNVQNEPSLADFATK